MEVKKWTFTRTMNSKRCYVAACVLDGKMYASGGNDRSKSYNTEECYDPETKQWTFITPMNSKRWGLAAGVLDGKIHAIGGLDDGCKRLNTVESLRVCM